MVERKVIKSSSEIVRVDLTRTPSPDIDWDKMAEEDNEMSMFERGLENG